MNYGYAPTKKDRQLAERLAITLEQFPPDAHGMRPYVEVNGLYKGVRIRRITHYSDDVIDQIVKACDKIYDEVVGDEKASWKEVNI